jgi:hypothetical protein
MIGIMRNIPETEKAKATPTGPNCKPATNEPIVTEERMKLAYISALPRPWLANSQVAAVAGG